MARITPFGYLCWSIIFVPFAALGMSVLLDGFRHWSLAGMGMGLVFVTVGGIGLGLGLRSGFRDSWLRKKGRQTSGVVTKLETDMSGDSTCYLLKFAFVDEAGEHRFGTMNLFQREFEKLAEGDAIKVYFDPHRPENCIAEIGK